jgi:hypothetical protein
MAWVTEYDMTWRGHNDAWGYIYLQRDEGTYQSPLNLLADSLEISRILPSWEQHIVRTNSTFTIANDLSDFYELMPLMTAVEGQVRVVVTNESFDSGNPIYMFEGFLNVETVERTMLQYSDLTLTASGLLNKLQYNHPASIDTLQYMTLIDIIDDCLSMTGTTYPIYIHCSLYEYNSTPGAGQTLFNRNGVYTELFWKNNIERKSALEILESILSAFNCYLYWHNQAWYIRHYQDLNQNTSWVIYQTGTSAGYGYADTGTTDGDTIIRPNIHSSPFFKQIGDTQKFQVVPGMKQVDVKMEQKAFYNLLNPDLSGLQTHTTAQPYLARREWWAFDIAPINWQDWEFGKSMKDIDNGAKRWNHDITYGDGQMNGLRTRFTTSTNGFSTELIITFKFGVEHIEWLCTWFAIDPSEFETDPQLTSITFYWFLSTWDAVFANRDFVVYNTTSGEWELVLDGTPQTDYNTLEITAADLDKDLFTYTGTLKIPIGDVFSSSSGDSDDLDLVFGIGTEMVDKSGETAAPATISCWYGDFRASISGQPENNLLQGEIVTGFLEKMTIKMDLFDAGWNYRNSLIIPTSIVYLTDTWGYGGTGYTLAKWMMILKFRLYRISRQKIIMDVHDVGLPIYAPLYPRLDNKQSNMVFIQLSEILYPQSNTHSMVLFEYDDTETINLV